MNILFLNTMDNRGGASRVAYSLKHGLEKLGHKTSMFVGEKHSSDENVFVLNNKKSLGGRIRRKLAYWLANDIDLFSSDKLIKTPQFKEADIVHCHNLHSYFFNLRTLEKISKLKPVVWTFHDMWPITAHCAHSYDAGVKDGFFRCPSLDIFPPIAWHNEKYLEQIKRKIYARSNFHIVTPSNWLKEKISQTLLKNKPISLIYNGIDTDIFKPNDKTTIRQELGLPQDKKIILSVIKGRLSNPWKGGKFILEAKTHYKDRPDILFINLGAYETAKENKKNNVWELPYVQNQSELAKYYAAADALLYPTLADNCPLVVLEALACGLPVISFRTGGVPELIDHQKIGYIADYANTQDLIHGLDWLFALSLYDRNEMRLAAAQTAQSKFTLNQMIQNHLDLYQRITK